MAQARQDIDWTALVNQLLDRLILTQAELADYCNVSQQTVSAWKIGKRPPGKFARRQLVTLAQQAGVMKPGVYAGVASVSEMVRERSPAHGAASRETREIVKALEAAPDAVRGEVLRFLKFRLGSADTARGATPKRG